MLSRAVESEVKIRPRGNMCLSSYGNGNVNFFNLNCKLFFSCKLPPSSKESVPVSLAPEYEVVCRVSFHFQKEDYVLFYKYLLINLIKQ